MPTESKWYEKAGECADVVLSTRVRLARNLKEYPFPNRLSDKQKLEVEEKVKNALLSSNSPVSNDFRFIQLSGLSDEQAVSLVERHIVSPEFVSDRENRGILLSSDESVSIMINEEDHLRIQVMGEGLSLKNTAETADRLDTLLSERLSFAFDSEFGFLTQCPTNLGTGMRASLMLHLPALTENGAMSRISANLSKLGLTLRGSYGEGSKVMGSVYQLSNQITLGLSENEAIDNLAAISSQLIGEERRAREVLRDNISVQDKIDRALGVLKSAKLLSSNECMELLSRIRFGLAAGLLEGIGWEELNMLDINSRPATLMAMSGHSLDETQRDAFRADMARRALKNTNARDAVKE